MGWGPGEGHGELGAGSQGGYSPGGWSPGGLEPWVAGVLGYGTGGWDGRSLICSFARSLICSFAHLLICSLLVFSFTKYIFIKPKKCLNASFINYWG